MKNGNGLDKKLSINKLEKINKRIKRDNNNNNNYQNMLINI